MKLNRNLGNLSLGNEHMFNLGIVSLIFVILNYYLFSILGVKVANDSPRYLEYAEGIIARGFYFDSHEFWYVGYVFFLIPFLYFGLPLYFLVIGQVVLGLIAVHCIYFTSIKIFDSRRAAFLSAATFVAFFEISIFNSYVLCEGIFVSLISLSMFLLVKWYKGEYSPTNLLFGIPLIILTSLTKPTGVSIIGVLVCVVLFRFYKTQYPIEIKFVFSAILLLPFLLLVNKMLSTFGFIDEYLRGDLIFGMFQYANSPYYDLLTIERPEFVQQPNMDSQPILRLLIFVFHHPTFWLKLFLGKLFLWLFHIRPFWSIWHNLFSIVFLTSTYFFGILGAVKLGISPVIRFSAFTFICFHGLSVGLMVEDWDGRFLLPIIPVVVLFAGAGLDWILRIREQRISSFSQLV